MVLEEELSTHSSAGIVNFRDLEIPECYSTYDDHLLASCEEGFIPEQSEEMSEPKDLDISGYADVTEWKSAIFRRNTT